MLFRSIARFDDFWAVWPKKEKKKDAKKAWSKNGCDAIADDIIADVEVSAAVDGKWRGDDLKFCPHPPSYLNSRRWEDEWTPKGNAGRLPREDEDEAARINAESAKRAEGW